MLEVYCIVINYFFHYFCELSFNLGTLCFKEHVQDQILPVLTISHVSS